MTGRKEIIEMVTDEIISLLDKGVAPWQQTWIGGNPANLVSGKIYKGINSFLLGGLCVVHGYTSRYWMTFQQIKSKGGHVIKGQKSTPVIFWKVVEKKGTNDEEKSTYAMLRYYRVFNLSQTDGIKDPDLENINKTNLPQKKAEEIISEMKNKPEIREGMKPCYIPVKDEIQIPKIEKFSGSNEFYSTLFHELTHSTGHSKRLNRDTLTEMAAFGSETYSKEELVAEMGAAFLSNICGVKNTIQNSAAYLQGWKKFINNDPKSLIKAASQAQKAVDYICGV
jgi:antirestriction protein ArdC